MADNFKFKEITSVDLEKKTISELADRPNKVSAFGEVGLAAQQLKDRFDAFPEVVKDKINEIIKALNSEDATKYIKMPTAVKMGSSLYDFLSFFQGDASDEGGVIDDKICAKYESPYNGKDGAQIGTLRGIIGQITSDYASLLDQNDTNSKKVNDLNDYGMAMDKLDGLVVEVKKLKDTFENIERAISDLEDRLDNIDNNVGA